MRVCGPETPRAKAALTALSKASASESKPQVGLLLRPRKRHPPEPLGAQSATGLDTGLEKRISRTFVLKSSSSHDRS